MRNSFYMFLLLFQAAKEVKLMRVAKVGSTRDHIFFITRVSLAIRPSRCTNNELN